MVTEAMPHSIESERGLLSCILQRPELLDEGKLPRPRDFYRREHAALFAVLQQMRRERHPIDAVTVPIRLSSSGQEERCGGVIYVVETQDYAPSTEAWRTYAATIRDLAKRREVIEAHQRLAAEAYDPSLPVERLIASARAAITEAEADDEGGHWRFTTELVGPVLDDVEQRSKGARIGYSTGFEALDAQQLLLCPGDLIILGARPNMGKSALMVQLVEGASRSAGQIGGILSLEMGDRQIVERMIARRAKVPASLLRDGRLDVSHWEAITNTAEDLMADLIAIDDRAGLSIDDIDLAARRLHRYAGGLSIIAVDYIQLVQVAQERGENRASAVGRVAYTLKKLAKELACPVLALGQLSRKVEERPDKRPMMSDLRDSGEIEQAADIVMFLYREGYYNEECKTPDQAEVIVAKGRNIKTGTALLAWRPDIVAFCDPTHQHLMRWGDGPPPERPRYSA